MTKASLFSTSLKLRLGLGAAALGTGAILAAGILFVGMTRVADRLETALASEQRIARYSTLSTQVSTFLIIAAEAVQSGLSPDTRMERIAPVADNIDEAFALARADLETAVAAAQTLGLDQQSRYGTQSLGIARMEALLANTLVGLRAETDRDRLRAYLDAFATGFDPLLNQAVNTEAIFRHDVLKSIDSLRRGLSLAGVAIAVLTLALVVLFYLLLVRPQFARLDQLREAAQRIGRSDFALSLSDTNSDEIGQLFAETNKAAQSLAAQQSKVDIEWARLNQTIDERTQDLRTANAKLEDIDTNRRRFFADVSHELRTPLTVILMEAQIGKTGKGDATDSFGTIENRAARLNRRIDDLLRVARSESGQLHLDPRPCDLAKIVQDAQQDMGAEIESAGMILTLDPLPGQTVDCDRNWVRQVIVGLIRNAIRHARTGGIVHIGLTPDMPGFAGLYVADNGPGILKQDQDTVFDRFAQAGTRRAEGFGVGLALAHWVITEQGGTIDLTSPSPHPLGASPGLRISLRLPISTSQARHD